MEEDKGADLIGMVVTRGSGAKYTIESYDSSVVLRSLVTKRLFRISLEFARNSIKSGLWKVVSTPEKIQGIPLPQLKRELGLVQGDVVKCVSATRRNFVVGDSYTIGGWGKIEWDGSTWSGDSGKFILVSRAVPLPSAQVPTPPMSPAIETMQTNINVNQLEGNIMKTTNLNVQVSTQAFKSITLTTVFGTNLEEMDEQGLFDALTSIKARETTLKELKTGTASKRITAQLKELTEARKSIIEAIDAL